MMLEKIEKYYDYKGAALSVIIPGHKDIWDAINFLDEEINGWSNILVWKSYKSISRAIEIRENLMEIRDYVSRLPYIPVLGIMILFGKKKVKKERLRSMYIIRPPKRFSQFIYLIGKTFGISELLRLIK